MTNQVERFEIDEEPSAHALYRAITEQVARVHAGRVVLGEGDAAVILAEVRVTRRCGNCSLCCTVAGVQELEKPPFTRCRHLAAGHGCGIYPDRPTACREFKCGWLQGNFDERFRPDKIGAYCAFFMSREHGAYAVVQVDSRIANHKRVRQMIRRLGVLPEVRVIYDDDHGVLFRHGAKPTLFRLLKRPSGDYESAVYMLEEVPA